MIQIKELKLNKKQKKKKTKKNKLTFINHHSIL